MLVSNSKICPRLFAAEIFSLVIDHFSYIKILAWL